MTGRSNMPLWTWHGHEQVTNGVPVVVPVWCDPDVVCPWSVVQWRSARTATCAADCLADRIAARQPLVRCVMPCCTCSLFAHHIWNFYTWSEQIKWWLRKSCIQLPRGRHMQTDRQTYISGRLFSEWSYAGHELFTGNVGLSGGHQRRQSNKVDVQIGPRLHDGLHLHLNKKQEWHSKHEPSLQRLLACTQSSTYTQL